VAEVYALYSGRDWVVRYVGQTTGDHRVRFKEHKRSAEGALRKWFREEWRAGYPIRCVLLEKCDENIRTQVERACMARFPGLLNERISAQTWFAGLIAKPPKVPGIVADRRRFIYNVGGFRGVHYDRHWDRYCVLNFTGSEAYWLIGNEDWRGGTMWFSDPTTALKARDRARRAWVQYPADTESE
jgi:hypothetical protein